MLALRRPPCDLTSERIKPETLALRESIEKGDISWGADFVAAHYRLAVTSIYFVDGTANTDWLTAHAGFPAALAAGSGSPTLERLRYPLDDAPEVSPTGSGVLPGHPTRPRGANEYRAVCDAALACDADVAVDLLTRHLETTARHPRQSPPRPTRRPTRWLADVAMGDRGHLR